MVTCWDETAARQTGKKHLKAEHLGSSCVLTCIHDPFMNFQHSISINMGLLWVPGFYPWSGGTHIRLTGDSLLNVGINVSVHGCFTMY